MTNVYIKRDSDGEYRVPAPDGGEMGAYYTDDADDAIGTCRALWGDSVYIRFRAVREHS